ncbi:hypothetical protein O988_04860 [Pseudogymnoascus sp. VKM F-3808]|nr:hypothetical protein O988_04860 [Pseudogymnoascus sp. VKM F-3808]
MGAKEVEGEHEGEEDEKGIVYLKEKVKASPSLIFVEEAMSKAARRRRSNRRTRNALQIESAQRAAKTRAKGELRGGE